MTRSGFPPSVAKRAQPSAISLAEAWQITLWLLN